MGLDTSHDAWHGSYSSFNEWRRIIARAAGFPELSEIVGFGGSTSWDAAPGDRRLVPLLNHSDCDGEISPKDCVGIADALEELFPKLVNLPNDWAITAARNFITGARAAAASDEPLDFH